MFVALTYFSFNYVLIFFLPVEIKQQRSKFISQKTKPLISINKLQCQIMELNLQLKHHSTFSSMIGATFGYHLWKATQIPVVANMVLQGVGIVV